MENYHLEVRTFQSARSIFSICRFPLVPCPLRASSTGSRCCVLYLPWLPVLFSCHPQPLFVLVLGAFPSFVTHVIVSSFLSPISHPHSSCPRYSWVPLFNSSRALLCCSLSSHRFCFLLTGVTRIPATPAPSCLRPVLCAPVTCRSATTTETNPEPARCAGMLETSQAARHHRGCRKEFLVQTVACGLGCTTLPSYANVPTCNFVGGNGTLVKDERNPWPRHQHQST